MSKYAYNNNAYYTFHTSFISKIVELTGCEIYLELGVLYGDNITEVAKYCECCIGVDISDVRIFHNFEFHQQTTDEFFKRFDRSPNIIFIDSDHNFIQVQKDFKNSLNCLSKHGVILLHDTDPISEDYITPQACDDSYKIHNWIRQEYPDLNIVTLPITEAGISIITRDEDRRHLNYLNNRDAKRYSANNNKWNYKLSPDYLGKDFWVGGLLSVSNLSTGFHGLLKQWWEYYGSIGIKDVLLVGENNIVKNELSSLYKNWNISTLDLYTELRDSKSDIIADICAYNLQLGKKYDLIINQAILEHVYNPFGAMKNMCEHLNKGGYLITHASAQNYPYHQFPRDYNRFMIDWWYDIPFNIKDIRLIELYEDYKSLQVFSCYEKL